MAVDTSERNKVMRKYFKGERAKGRKSWKIIWELADKYTLELKTIEDIIYKKRKIDRR